MESTIVSENVFGRSAVKRLSDGDFTLDADIPIKLKWTDCTLILFYVNNIESIQLMQIWATAANLAAGPIFAGINMSISEKVAQAFMRVREIPGPYRLFGTVGYPFIIAYQGGHPVGFYNGERDVQAIADWALTLACRIDYFEPAPKAGAVQADISYEMGGVTDLAPRTVSTEFKAGQPMRGFDSKIGVVQTGTTAAVQAAGEEATERAAVEEGAAVAPAAAT